MDTFSDSSDLPQKTFNYSISILYFYSQKHKKYGYYCNEDNCIKFENLNIPEKFIDIMDGKFGDADFYFFEDVIENSNSKTIEINSDFYDSLPNIDNVIRKYYDEISNDCDINEYKIHYIKLKEFIYYLVNNTELNMIFIYDC